MVRSWRACCGRRGGAGRGVASWRVCGRPACRTSCGPRGDAGNNPCSRQAHVVVAVADRSREQERRRGFGHAQGEQETFDRGPPVVLAFASGCGRRHALGRRARVSSGAATRSAATTATAHAGDAGAAPMRLANRGLLESPGLRPAFASAGATRAAPNSLTSSTGATSSRAPRGIGTGPRGSGRPAARPAAALRSLAKLRGWWCRDRLSVGGGLRGRVGVGVDDEDRYRAVVQDVVADAAEEGGADCAPPT
jgi:hypothetical protein